MSRKQIMVCNMLLLFLLPCFMPTLLLTRSSFARSTNQTVVEVDPQANSAEVGKSFTVNVTVVDVQNLYGLEAHLYWNGSVLEPTRIDVRLGLNDGALNAPLGPLVENSTQEGEYNLVCSSVAPAPPFNGTGIMVGITFRVTSAGASELLLSVDLADYPPLDRDPRISLPIDHGTINGTFSSIVPEVSNWALFLGLVVVTAVAVVYSRRIIDKTRRKSFWAEGF
jgi:hypothetical protein